MKILLLKLKGWLYRLSSKSYLNRKIVLCYDLFFSLVCCFVSLWKTSTAPSSSFFYWKPLFILAMLCTNLLGFLFLSLRLKTYRQIFRYSSMRVLRYGVLLVFYTSLISMLCATLILICVGRSIVVQEILFFGFFYFILEFSLFVLGRYLLISLARWVLQNRFTRLQTKKKILVYGVQENSVALSHQLKNNAEYSVVGFCTRDKEKSNYQVDGLSIFCIHGEKDLGQLAESYSLDGILFPAECDFLHERTGFIYLCESIHLHTYLMPTISECSTLKVASASIQRIRIEDLLMRDEIKSAREEVCKELTGKVVLVTGAAGSIGSELVKQIAKLNCVKRLVLFDNAETPLHNIRLHLEKEYPSLALDPIVGDVRSQSRLRYLFERFHPEIVLHAAAYKHVPLMEENPCESVLVNVIGTKNIADLCLAYNVEKMVMISTDKAVNPTNVMGASKRAAEIYVQSLGRLIATGVRPEKTIFVTTRFGNVLGSQGSVIELFRRQIAEGGPITVTDPEVERYFMSIPEACSLILQASTLATQAQIFVFDMGEKHKIDDLAKNMIRLAGFEPDKDIKIVYTGLRPGEKLYEEVLASKENVDATTIDKIKIAKIRPMEYSEIIDKYDQLLTLSKQVEILQTVKVLKELVPEYKSAHSQFEALDKASKPNLI